MNKNDPDSDDTDTTRRSISTKISSEFTSFVGRVRSSDFAKMDKGLWAKRQNHTNASPSGHLQPMCEHGV